eukprot:363371-Chlamydomonas_euryale.AAC.15
MVQGNSTLEQRVWRMLHIEADPLDETSSSRFRLRLRETDDEFWSNNIMKSLLPSKFYFTGLPANEAAAAEADIPAGTSQSRQKLHALNQKIGCTALRSLTACTIVTCHAKDDLLALIGAQALEAEAHWRLYSNAVFMRSHLENLCAQDGFNLQDFMLHV